MNYLHTSLGQSLVPSLKSDLYITLHISVCLTYINSDMFRVTLQGVPSKTVLALRQHLSNHSAAAGPSCAHSYSLDSLNFPSFDNSQLIKSTQTNIPIHGNTCLVAFFYCFHWMITYI